MLDYLKTATNIFGKQKLTQHEVIFSALVYNTIHTHLFSNDEKIAIKKKFLNWQNNETPKINPILKEFCYEFYHMQDMTWESLNSWFVLCEWEYNIHNKTITPEIEKMISDEFPV